MTASEAVFVIRDSIGRYTFDEVNSFITSLAFLLGTAECHLFVFLVFVFVELASHNQLSATQLGGNKLASTIDESDES